MKYFELGDRVRIVGHWEFPNGVVGTIREPEAFQRQLAEPGEWEGHRRTLQARRGPMVFYYVEFDDPADDGSGDGPYSAAEIPADALEVIDGEPSP